MAFLSRAASTLFAASAVLVIGCASQTGSEPANGTVGSGSGSGSGSGVAAAGFQVVPLTSDQPNVAPNVDPNLINPWGMAMAQGAFWIADNGTGVVSILDQSGAAARVLSSTTGAQVSLTLEKGITGAAVNPSTTAFFMPAAAGCPTNSVAAKMLFSSESGKIWAVNADVNALQGFVVVDRSSVGAVYKGIAIVDLSQAPAPGGGSGSSCLGSGSGSGTQRSGFRILATDFANGRIDVFDENFNLLSESLPTTGGGSGSGSGSATNAQQTMFLNPTLQAGYAPFNVAMINGQIYVTYAQQDAAKMDDVKGAGLGRVDVFDVDGNFVRTLIDVGGLLNAPWGITLASADFCTTTANQLLIGNFGDGHIVVVVPESGRVLGLLADQNGGVLAIDGLWSLMFGDGKGIGQTNQLFFTSGPDDETHGLFGMIQQVSGSQK